MAILDEVKQETEANKDRIWSFWFSAKQKTAMSERGMDGKPYRLKFVTIDGKRHEYTECMSGDHIDKKCNWEDAIYLGETTWRNVG